METGITATRYHDFSCGHRVHGHESKCAYLHGHNYRVTFTIKSEREEGLDQVGRVLDFSAIKDRLCSWLEERWDHKFLAWEEDPIIKTMSDRCYAENESDSLLAILRESIVLVPFNPTAENMAQYLLEEVGPAELRGTGTRLIKVEVEETRKCSATAFSS